MKKTYLIFRNEFISTITRRSFLITLFLFPIIGFVVMAVISGVQKSTGTDASSMISDLLVPSAKETLEGFVDQSGLVKAIPEGYQYRLEQFASEKDAQEALKSQKISAYYIIDTNYLENGKIVYVRPDFNPLGGSVQSSSIDALMAYNLTGGNLDLYYRVQNPINVQTQEIDSTGPVRDENSMMTFFLPYVVTFLFYIVIFLSASLLLNSITGEKQNRTIEVLLTSVTPDEMLTGKILALGVAGLMQTIIWFGSGLLLLKISNQTLALSDAFVLPASILAWGILFFLFGYAVYASIMAGIGAMVPNVREASQFTIIVVLPLIIPLMFISSLIQAPNSVVSIFLSLFPLTSPIAMMTRLSATTVPIWQTLLALALVGLTAFYLIKIMAGLFRAQNLLAGKSPTVKEFLQILANKN
jgi:ABC-2 type transport system permease protein